ncbi:GTP-binding protein TypA/BipA [invertebrate metagenome]|uniref:GTP-binding protein TypA/BipA n=1 Tax=invertebrate metagenome TaxID=1711999 RepID=A0A484H893_9ZZZZ
MDVRNVAIIAHVDHGKTTLVSNLLKQRNSLRNSQQLWEHALDYNDLERERGITILAKCTSVDWQGVKINIIDTPGHADLGGEVERILSMVDGVVVLVDAAEGPLPQTKFVVQKALGLQFCPIVIINKVDRADARPDQVHNDIFDLFAMLDANDAQLDFPTLYASGRDGWAVQNLEKTERRDLTPLLDLILRHVPPPACDQTAPFTMLVTTLEYDPYLGRVLSGRIHTGVVRVNMPIKAIRRDRPDLEQARAVKLLSFRGLDRVPVAEVAAGDIVAIAGLGKATVSDTLCALEVTFPLPAIPIDPPTLAMTFSVNDSPLAGCEGDKVTSRIIRTRLQREAEGNIAIRVTESTDRDTFEVAGRGELQLGILIETMRREGFELSISQPRVLFITGADGLLHEPIEEILIDVDDEFVGVVVKKMNRRKAELASLKPSGRGRARLVFHAPSRGLIGYRSEFLTDTRGTGIINRLYHGYAPYKGCIEGRHVGVLVAGASGLAVSYALWNLEERGTLFIHPGTRVYQGMIIGEHSRGDDLEVNPLRTKQLTNFRAASRDDSIRLVPPRQMSLEEALAYIAEGELVEVTPKSLRLRKRYLDPRERRRAARIQKKNLYS